MWRPEARRAPKIPLRQAVALGALHGLAELLPISSSGHVGAVPWLLGWSYAELEGEQRKTFEVALHAGSAAALLLSQRKLLGRLAEPRAAVLIAAASAPAAAAGYALEGPIEERLGTPPTIAAGLVAGSVAMVIGDQAPQARGLEHAGLADALLLGVAQATALVPGVSRHGAALSAARLRRFTRRDAHRLSLLVALPPVAGATVVRALALRRRPDPPLVVGGAAAFASTLVCARILDPFERGAALWPFAVYRIGLAAAILARLRRGSRARRRRAARP